MPVTSSDRAGAHAFVAMFDRWNPDSLHDRRGLWLPLTWINDGFSIQAA